MIQKNIHLGPIHPWLPGAMKLSLDLQGDQIISSQVEFGYLSKAIEAKVKGLRAVEAQRYFSRIEPESAFLLDRLFSEVIEKAVGIQLTERALWVRDVTTLISELNGFLKYLAQMANRLGIDVLEHILLKHREELLDLIELLTGSRYGYYFLQPGGSRYDITDGFIERLEAWIKNYKADYSRIESMYLWTHPFHNRLKSLGRIVDDGKMGFVSHSSIESTQYGTISHVESRLLYALKQTLEVSEELHELTGARHSDSFLAMPFKDLEVLPIKEAKVKHELETGRGLWSLTMSVKKGLGIESVELITPSHEISRAIAPALEDEQFEDIPLILQSLNLLVTEVDR